MKKILVSLMVLAFVSGGVWGATSAFFSDVETSAGNTLEAGDIDLTVGNKSYYNGAVSTNTSWALANLTQEKFFNFVDLKPGDWGEDTIELKVTSNDSYACLDVNITATPENGVNEPEAVVDTTTATNEGELQNLLKFVFWADDGDNVLETNEVNSLLFNGTMKQLSDGDKLILADSSKNAWTGTKVAMTGNQSYYVGKAWCLGDLTLAPVTAGQGVNPTVNGGVLCNGVNVTNASQTDGVVADVILTAEQSRNNAGFLCNPIVVTTGDSFAPVPTPDWIAKARYGDNIPNAGAYEIELGKGAGLRTEANAAWTNGQVESFTLTHDGVSTATFTIGTRPPVVYNNVPPVMDKIGLTAKTQANGTVIVDNLKVNGLSVGAVDGVTAPGVAPSNYEHLLLTNVPAGAFTLEGTFTFNWVSSANETPAVEIHVY